MGLFDEIMKIKINQHDWIPRFSLRSESSGPKKSQPPAPAPQPSAEEIARRETEARAERERIAREERALQLKLQQNQANWEKHQGYLKAKQEAYEEAVRRSVGVEEGRREVAIRNATATMLSTNEKDITLAMYSQVAHYLPEMTELQEDVKHHLEEAKLLVDKLSIEMADAKKLYKEAALRLCEHYEEAVQLISQQIGVLTHISQHVHVVLTSLASLKSSRDLRIFEWETHCDIEKRDALPYPLYEIEMLKFTALGLKEGKEAEILKRLAPINGLINSITTYANQASDIAINLRKLCETIDALKIEVAQAQIDIQKAEKALNGPELTEIQAPIIAKDTEITKVEPCAQEPAVPLSQKEVSLDKPSFVSLELFLKCAHQLLASDEDLASKLKQRDITPAAMLFFLDFVINTATRAPAIQYNRHAREEEKSFCAIQRFFTDEKRRKPSERRMMEHFDKDNHFLQSYVSLEMPQVTIGLDNPVVKAAANALTYMQQKMRTQPFDFFKTTQVNIIDMPSERPDLEQGADAIEVSARSINHLDLPADIQETIDDFLAFEEKDVVQMSILSS